MKKIKLTQQDKKNLLAEFSKKLDEMEETIEEDKFSFEKRLKEPAKEKILIRFTPKAFLRSQKLVNSFVGEIGWHGLINKISDKEYLVYDIMVYPQVVSGARTLDPTKTNEWYEKWEDSLEDMHFQAHSHNTMGTTPSTTDMDNQANIIRNLQGEGFYLFQIWNKAGDINSFLYDLDNNVMYDRNDIEVIVDDMDFGTLDKFVLDAKTMVEDMPNSFKPYKKDDEGDDALKSHYKWVNPMSNLELKEIKNPFYWNNGMGSEGWD